MSVHISDTFVLLAVAITGLGYAPRPSNDLGWITSRLLRDDSVP
jgi:hypothetical protein